MYYLSSSDSENIAPSMKIVEGSQPQHKALRNETPRSPLKEALQDSLNGTGRGGRGEHSSESFADRTEATLAAQLGRHMVDEVRRLQAQLAMKDEDYQLMRIEADSATQSAADLDLRVKSLLKEQDNLRTANWDLETMNQRNLELISELTTTKDKLETDSRRIMIELTRKAANSDALQSQCQSLRDDIAKSKADTWRKLSQQKQIADDLRLEIEALLSERDQNLSSQKLNALESATNSASRGTSVQNQADRCELLTEDDDAPYLAPGTPQRMSPVKQSNLESETMQQALLHQQNKILRQRRELEREKSQRIELESRVCELEARLCKTKRSSKTKQPKLQSGGKRHRRRLQRHDDLFVESSSQSDCDLESAYSEDLLVSAEEEVVKEDTNAAANSLAAELSTHQEDQTSHGHDSLRLDQALTSVGCITGDKEETSIFSHSAVQNPSSEQQSAAQANVDVVNERHRLFQDASTQTNLCETEEIEVDRGYDAATLSHDDDLRRGHSTNGHKDVVRISVSSIVTADGSCTLESPDRINATERLEFVQSPFASQQSGQQSGQFRGKTETDSERMSLATKQPSGIAEMAPPIQPSYAKDTIRNRATAIPNEARNTNCSRLPSDVATTRSHSQRTASSISSFASHIDDSFRLDQELLIPDSQGAITEPRMIESITRTMIGTSMYKYTRKTGRQGLSDNRHRRYFWVHPYTKTLYWSVHNPVCAPEGAIIKSAPVVNISVVLDDNRSPRGLHDQSIMVETPKRALKLTATCIQDHDAWVDALSFLISTSEEVYMKTTKGRASMRTKDQTSLQVQQHASIGHRVSALFQQGSLSRSNSKTSMQQVDRRHLTLDDVARGLSVENVRTCCNGQHDVGSLCRRPPRSRSPSRVR